MSRNGAFALGALAEDRFRLSTCDRCGRVWRCCGGSSAAKNSMVLGAHGWSVSVQDEVEVRSARSLGLNPIKHLWDVM